MSLMRARADVHYRTEAIGSDLSEGVIGYLSRCPFGLFITQVLTETPQPLV